MITSSTSCLLAMQFGQLLPSCTKHSNTLTLVLVLTNVGFTLAAISLPFWDGQPAIYGDLEHGL